MLKCNRYTLKLLIYDFLSCNEVNYALKNQNLSLFYQNFVTSLKIVKNHQNASKTVENL